MVSDCSSPFSVRHRPPHVILMEGIGKVNNPYDDDEVIDSCSLNGVMNVSRKRFSSKDSVRAMTYMHERTNGLGGGFAI